MHAGKRHCDQRLRLHVTVTVVMLKNLSTSLHGRPLIGISKRTHLTSCWKRKKKPSHGWQSQSYSALSGTAVQHADLDYSMHGNVKFGNFGVGNLNFEGSGSVLGVESCVPIGVHLLLTCADRHFCCRMHSVQRHR